MYNFLIYFKFELNNNLTSDINQIIFFLIELYKLFLLFSFCIENFTTLLNLLISIKYPSIIGKTDFINLIRKDLFQMLLLFKESNVLQIDFLFEAFVSLQLQNISNFFFFSTKSSTNREKSLKINKLSTNSKVQLQAFGKDSMIVSGEQRQQLIRFERSIV
ncbi:unnamed protein product [Paramecium sonneborni]|uniref:Uncharacterized protein n=1 Tax=Paramecium sonneborni TaxID=65129 RepID=A0A8S1QK14_9CILI|nr:unnamed protein product [Paramecium sonneborni]